MFAKLPRDQKAYQAVLNKDWHGFQSLVAQRLVTADDASIASEAMMWGEPRVVDLVGQYFSGKGLAMAVNVALEAGRNDQAQVLFDHAERRMHQEHTPILDLDQALGFSINAGQLVAQQALLDKGATREGLARLGIEPLCAAAVSNQVAMLDHWLPRCTRQTDRDDALMVAVEMHANRAILRLWPVSSRQTQHQAMNEIATRLLRLHRRKADWQDWMETLGGVLSLCQPGDPVAVSAQPAVEVAFERAVRFADGPSATVFLPWLDPNANKARPLRWALEMKRSDLVAELLPCTDVSLAREAWIAARPARWDMVDALATWVSPPVRQAWLTDPKHAQRMPQALAMEREGQTLTKGPAEHRRRRPRS